MELNEAFAVLGAKIASECTNPEDKELGEAIVTVFKSLTDSLASIALVLRVNAGMDN